MMYIESEYEAVSAICNAMKDKLIITSVGNISRIIYDITGSSHNVFYMLGSMGLSISFGLGLALSNQDRHIISFVGDGAALMNLSSFILLGSYKVKYTVVIIDNGIYNTTGGQKSNSENIIWEDLLKSLGISSIYCCSSMDELVRATKYAEKQTCCSVILVKTMPLDKKINRVMISPKDNANNFKNNLRGVKHEY